MALLADHEVVARMFGHIDRRESDMGDAVWREPVESYRSASRLIDELALMRRLPVPFCPSAALPRPGDFVAREAAGVPLVAVRGHDGVVRVFRNACRHRGVEVARGSGNTRAFVCAYHAWSYGLDGQLRGVPHENGFPGLDRAAHGLKPVAAREHGGVVFVAQEGTIGDADFAGLPTLFEADWTPVEVLERDLACNWKVFAESFLEGYHIRYTHGDTFFPRQYDNINVVEPFGRYCRIAFPYQSIEKLRGRDPARTSVAGKLTYVYHLFPNAVIATFPKRTILTVLEPRGTAVTRYHTWSLASSAAQREDAECVGRDAEFAERGIAEDRAVVESIQRGMTSGANDAYTFGLYESAIVHFHRNLHTLIGAPA